MKESNLKERTKNFALRIIKHYAALPKTTKAQILGKQILRSGASVGAQYREGCRVKSNAGFTSKIEGALQELDETCYWLELLGESKFFSAERLKAINTEAEELIRILVTVVKNVKEKSKN